MMDSSKLQLSAEESAMVQNSHWLLTKNIIIQKASLLFGEAASLLQNMLSTGSGIPAEVLDQSPKIAKGENYKGLPYVMLDYPRFFGRENIFAFRTMFWWGNFISVTWQLKGTYAKMYATPLAECFPSLASAGFHICISEDEWRHDFEPDNYQPLSTMSYNAFTFLLADKSFIKLAVRIPLSGWNNAHDRLSETYRMLLEVAGN